MKHSAGIVLFRIGESGLDVLLTHPTGHKRVQEDFGRWSIPKGEFTPGDENALDAAKREFFEEIGIVVPWDDSQFIDLGAVQQSPQKVVHAFAYQGSLDISKVKCNTFNVESPKGSGRYKELPENDQTKWFPFAVAISKINPGQLNLLMRLVKGIGK
jgi:predicted NUDIX family NTP pyrophosphohydrolase